MLSLPIFQGVGVGDLAQTPYFSTLLYARKFVSQCSMFSSCSLDVRGFFIFLDCGLMHECCFDIITHPLLRCQNNDLPLRLRTFPFLKTANFHDLKKNARHSNRGKESLCWETLL